MVIFLLIVVFISSKSEKRFNAYDNVIHNFKRIFFN